MKPKLSISINSEADIAGMRVAGRLGAEVLDYITPFVKDRCLGDIGYVIQQHAEKNRYSVVREFYGHGIGRVFHEAPQVRLFVL